MSARCGRVMCGRRAERGFTLTELMVVVIITGILAALAFGSFQKQASAAWRAEGLGMVQSLRAAQERWRGEHMIYLDVSGVGMWYPATPQYDTLHPFYFSGTGEHPNQDEWFALRPTAPGPVRFGYLMNAGAGGVAMTIPSAPGPSVTWPDNPNDWYVIQAVAATDRSGGSVYMRASSLNGDVFVSDQD